MKRAIIIFTLISLFFQTKAQISSCLYESDGNKVKLRWRGVHTPAIEGYNVYRKQGEGEWQKLNSNPLKPVWNYVDLKTILGYKTAAYLQLFGASDEKKQSINRVSWDSTFNKKGAEAFIGAMSLINPEYAMALGETFEDEPSDKSKSYFYKVTLLEAGNKETDLAKSEAILPSTRTRVPSTSEVFAVSGNASVKLEWKKEKELLKKGTIVTYKIYRSFELLGPFEPVNYFGLLSATVSTGNSTEAEIKESYTVDFLENGETYYFKIKAVNAFGTESQNSETVSAIPLDPQLNEAPGSVQISKSGKMVKLVWKDIKSIAVFRSEINKKSFKQIYPANGVVLPPINKWYDNMVTEGREYWYILKTLDKNGNFSPPGDTLHIFVPDNTAPGKPANVKAVAKKGLIIVTWDANTEADLLGYEVERASDKRLVTRFMLTKSPIVKNSYNDSLQFMSQTTFGYVVYAIDKSYNRSLPSKMVTARMPDYDPPARPLIIGLSENDSGVQIKWQAPPDEDVSNYRIYRKIQNTAVWDKRGETINLKFTDVAGIGLFDYAVTAVDSSKNESEKSFVQTINVKADKSLLIPVYGKASIENGTITLNWEKAPNATPQGWVITRVIGDKNLDIATLDKETLSYCDPYPEPGKIKYEVRARNAEWQMGVPLIILVEYKP